MNRSPEKSSQRLSIASFGAGNMARALYTQMAVQRSDLNFHLFTPSHTSAQLLAKELNELSERSTSAYDNLSQLPSCDLYILACKPQQLKDLVDLLKQNKLTLRKDSVVISLLAGTSVKTISELLEHDKVVRVMPNTPVQCGRGVNLLYSSSALEASERQLVAEVFSAGAKVYTLESEQRLDDLTVIAGSGPGYIFEFARIFQSYLESSGLDSESSKEMVSEVFLGTALLMTQSETSFEDLRNQVTSKRGVTEAALDSFKKDNLENIFADGLKAARKRIDQLK